MAALLTKLGQSLHTVIEMRVDDETLVKRIVNRAEEARAAAASPCGRMTTKTAFASG